jgi:hypothetical protein
MGEGGEEVLVDSSKICAKEFCPKIKTFVGFSSGSSSATLKMSTTKWCTNEIPKSLINTSLILESMAVWGLENRWAGWEMRWGVGGGLPHTPWVNC